MSQRTLITNPKFKFGCQAMRNLASKSAKYELKLTLFFVETRYFRPEGVAAGNFGRWIRIPHEKILRKYLPRPSRRIAATPERGGSENSPISLF